MNVGDHPWIKHKTCINFGACIVVSNTDLDDKLALGEIIAQPPIDPPLLDRIRLNSSLSKRMQEQHYSLLEDQGLIPF